MPFTMLPGTIHLARLPWRGDSYPAARGYIEVDAADHAEGQADSEKAVPSRTSTVSLKVLTEPSGCELLLLSC
jgi:hypothetical protein